MSKFENSENLENPLILDFKRLILDSNIKGLNNFVERFGIKSITQMHDENGGNPFHWLVEKRLDGEVKTDKSILAVLQWLNEKGFDINHKDNSDDTPLVILCNKFYGIGSVKIAQSMIQMGANVNFSGAHGYTPLHWAATYFDVNLMKALVSNGGDLLQPMYYKIIDRNSEEQVYLGRTPLELVIENGNFNDLLKNMEPNGIGDLVFSLVKEKNWDLVDTVLNYPELKNNKGKSGRHLNKALIEALSSFENRSNHSDYQNSKKIIKKLLSLGAGLEDSIAVFSVNKATTLQDIINENPKMGTELKDMLWDVLINEVNVNKGNFKLKSIHSENFLTLSNYEDVRFREMVKSFIDSSYPNNINGLDEMIESMKKVESLGLEKVMGLHFLREMKANEKFSADDIDMVVDRLLRERIIDEGDKILEFGRRDTSEGVNMQEFVRFIGNRNSGLNINGDSNISVNKPFRISRRPSVTKPDIKPVSPKSLITNSEYKPVSRKYSIAKTDVKPVSRRSLTNKRASQVSPLISPVISPLISPVTSSEASPVVSPLPSPKRRSVASPINGSRKVNKRSASIIPLNDIKV